MHVLTCDAVCAIVDPPPFSGPATPSATSMLSNLIIWGSLGSSSWFPLIDSTSSGGGNGGVSDGGIDADGEIVMEVIMVVIVIVRVVVVIILVAYLIYIYIYIKIYIIYRIILKH